MRFFSPTSARVPGWAVGGTAAAFITHPQNRPSITNGGMTKKEGFFPHFLSVLPCSSNFSG